jgi:hypothetical protein
VEEPGEGSPKRGVPSVEQDDLAGKKAADELNLVSDPGKTAPVVGLDMSVDVVGVEYEESLLPGESRMEENEGQQDGPEKALFHV